MMARAIPGLIGALGLCSLHLDFSQAAPSTHHLHQRETDVSSLVADLPHSYALAPNCTLSWDVDATNETITFGVDCVSPGWFGLGLGELNSGAMAGADIYTIEEEEEGKFTVVDRFSTAQAFPSADTCSSATLLGAKRDGERLIAAFQRALDTKDPGQDRPITTGPTRILFARGTSGKFGYHGTDRGTTTIHFMNKTSNATAENATDSVNATETENVTTIDLTFNEYVVSENVTSYICTSWDILPMVNDSAVHVIAFEPIIDNRTFGADAPKVHHVTVHLCDGDNNTDFGKWNVTPGDCLMGGKKGCQRYVFAFASGGGIFELPKEAGFVLGNSSMDRYVLIEMHYDNPKQTANHTDSSGVRLHVTKNLRENNAGLMVLGSIAMNQNMTIPAKSPMHEYEFDCPGKCTERWTENLMVFADFLHMHQIGSKMWTSHTSANGSRYPDLNRVDYFSFGMQQFVTLDPPRTLQPGDRLSTHCVYSNPTENEVDFGLQSDEEMCMDFVMYYPAVPDWTYCGHAIASPPGMQPFNVTLCGSIKKEKVLITQPNPTMRDPPITLENYFGMDTSANYTCSN